MSYANFKVAVFQKIQFAKILYKVLYKILYPFLKNTAFENTKEQGETAANDICGGLALLFCIFIRLLVRYLFHTSPFYKFRTDLDLYLCLTVNPVC